MIVALDSFDEPRSGCTTLTASLLALHLASKGFRMLDYPRLVRLNPAVPWKTRGNAAVALEFEGSAEELFEEAKAFLERAPGRGALAVGEEFPEVYPDAVEKVLDPDEVAKKFEGLWWGRKEALVGALAAGAAEGLNNFELLAYRLPQNLGRPRRCSFHPAYEALLELAYPSIHESSPEVVCPKGPDPVLLGIRGSHPPLMWAALQLFDGEPFWLATMFRTNQHSYEPSRRAEEYPYEFVQKEFEGSYEVRGEDVLFGDYVLFNETGITKIFKEMIGYENKVSVKLDVVVKPGSKGVAALRDLRALFWKRKAPKCPKCGGPMVSMGKKTLMRKCKKCGYKAEVLPKLEIKVFEGTVFPVQGRKLHLEGDYRSPPWPPEGRICEKPGCAIWVAHGFDHH
ncbi:TiaS agmantine-binding domain-containing protein [Ignicoccus hospitalis]|uniref:tRNA(Ile2) 2-agmatinylcytidine synthetase TiaS n=1 Tax=Ignicoccus hospitalis (strain KIN4/I / DSM 18386 / JCM 14125) TaxID=453591 RepID=TIAS_IGNH4|nr:DUF1743 domain-containing protein [Ignicoccus hospitalis]A8A990.1 RecName: Full=tRNA(Ile2) 2-agmatinylcytidine synthetase TiaS; Short=tRNA(Ile2)-agm2C synthetase; AltName: Full=tRNA(Ile2) agmatidine synthetase [Ignicoccus hospitalis KIN4/I]ABU81492.1 DNA-binding protein containing a Zn-ribbon domain-like protein [Ignicoccus hospitalis KIN4/I]HIH90426.1 DUF1743 domain-containing protein [Desulfurococcaceae archaeon]